ncbi:marginal zone B- and B1-cell-specific protein [Alligator mississippiensis]|uniref:Marginal zone B- and B1-cell-specific protein n=1 Tax=Alligator mississippiensis TaxID=8496 RepID=A0A151NQT6_ALLMI|nr:marginal zone B- and B1-cell-specific protein [Alligator mississippiensis]KYO39211.1 marginal zone B- and B1-cell-specific protein [Alligator mississippiensis]
MKLLVTVFLVLSFCELRQAEDGKSSSSSNPLQDSPPVSERAFSASSPQLSAEETYSAHMPEHLLCDACRAISFQMQQYLEKAESKWSLAKKPGALLSESEYVDALENSCSQSWENYGVKEVNGVKRFAGPGLKSQESMSVMMTGGPWPARLYMMCHSYLGESGEEQIYEEHRRRPGGLEEFLCYGAKKACTRFTHTKDRIKVKSLQSEL